jgi:GTP cyclohydrolase IA
VDDSRESELSEPYMTSGGETDMPEVFTELSLLKMHVASILDILGYDRVNDQHFLRTPFRYAQVLMEFAKNGEEESVAKLLEVSFSDEHDGLVIVGPIRVVSMCAHHLLPVTGRAWVGYIPSGRVCGLSKLARLVHHFARQATVQERVTDQVVDALMDHLHPLGAATVIRAEHGCMSLRGVAEPAAITTTSAVRGVFLQDPAAKAEFMGLIRE